MQRKCVYSNFNAKIFHSILSRLWKLSKEKTQKKNNFHFAKAVKYIVKLKLNNIFRRLFTRFSFIFGQLYVRCTVQFYVYRYFNWIKINCSIFSADPAMMSVKVIFNMWMNLNWLMILNFLFFFSVYNDRCKHF